MDYSAFADVIDLAAFFGFCCGFSVVYVLDFLIDFIIKKKRQIAEKRKKGE